MCVCVFCACTCIIWVMCSSPSSNSVKLDSDFWLPGNHYHLSLVLKFLRTSWLFLMNWTGTSCLGIYSWEQIEHPQAFIVQNIGRVFKKFSIWDFLSDLGSFCFYPHESKIVTLSLAPVNELHHVLISAAVWVLFWVVGLGVPHRLCDTAV